MLTCSPLLRIYPAEENEQMRIRQLLGVGILGACTSLFAWAQGTKNATVVTVEQPDAQKVKEELSQLLEHYPPSLRNVLALDPGLLYDQSYLAPYPALVSFASAHPEIAHNPSFYIGETAAPRSPQDHATQVTEMWRDVLNALAVFAGFGMGIGLLVWLIRTLIDYRRWNRLAKVQTEVHTKLLDRFTTNNDLLAYIDSPAGSKFLQSTPIMLDAAPRSVGAPLGRILWSLQGGVVLLAGGIGLQFVSTRVADDASQPLHVLGILGVALGVGFVVSAILSFVISQRLGLIEPARTLRTETPGSPE
jgi:hypothetical protein